MESFQWDDARRRRIADMHLENMSSSNVDEGEGDETAQDLAPPDPKAWLCVLGAFTFTIPSYGFSQSVGTIQSYLQQNVLPEHSTSSVGWISGLYLFLSYFFTLQIGPICDRAGPIKIGSIGVVITLVSFFLLAECTAYWQFMLCIGVGAALGSAMVATIALSVVAKLFQRRRGLAIGAALTGSAMGGIIFPLILRSTLPNLGFQWSIRIVALGIAGVTIPGLCCFLPYSGLSNGTTIRVSSWRDAVLDFSAFRSLPFTLVTSGTFLLEFAIFGIAGLLPTMAIDAGLASEDGFLLITVLSACSLLGRLLHGLTADVIGPFNTILLTITSSLIFMCTLFIPFAENSKSVIYAFAALWGFFSGPFLSIPPVCMGKTCPARDYGRYFGTLTFFVSFSVLLTVPLGGVLLDALGFQALAALFTAVVFCGGVCYVTARALVGGKWLAVTLKV